MIDLYFSPTPNGLKVRLFLEEAKLPYRIVPVRLSKGEQHRPDYVAIAPNSRIPAVVDDDGDTPLAMFESGAIMLYLAEKTGRLIPADMHGRAEVLQWLFWQMSALGPIAGQIGHFNVFAPERIPYAIDRFSRELRRLYGVLDMRLRDREFIAGSYSIADIACYPWIVPHRGHGQRLEEFPHLRRWFDAMSARPATVRVYEDVEDVYAPAQPMSAEERRILFGRTAAAG